MTRDLLLPHSFLLLLCACWSMCPVRFRLACLLISAIFMYYWCIAVRVSDEPESTDPERPKTRTTRRTPRVRARV